MVSEPQQPMSMDSSLSNASSSSVGSSQSNPSIFLLSNICNLVPVRFDSSNYLFWRFQVESMLEAHSLFRIIDESTPCPSEYLVGEDGSKTSNPTFSKWIAQDHVLITLINVTMSKTAFSFVIGCKTTREVWLTLEKRFSSLNRSHIHELKFALYTIAKSSTELIEDYLLRIKEILDKLANVVVVIDDEDVPLYTLIGLPSEYNAFRTSIWTCSETVTLEELHALLKSKVKFLDQQHKTSSPFNPIIIVSTLGRGGSNSLRGCEQFPNNSRGRSNSSPFGRTRGNNNGGSNGGNFNKLVLQWRGFSSIW